MRYKKLWLLAFGMLLLDMATTVYMMGNGFSEANETVVRMMEQHGQIAGLSLSVAIRTVMLGVGIALQRVTIEQGKPFPIAILLPASAAPAIHNIVLYATGVTLLW